jgi:hypothetical protein
MVESFSYVTTKGVTFGTLTTAVFQEQSGTLDFYYQITNNQHSRTSVARLSAVDFDDSLTDVGFRTDGASLPGGLFVNGACSSIGSCPFSSDRTGASVGFDFGPTDPGRIAPGQTSLVFVISTNAMHMALGNAELIDGGSEIVRGFQPVMFAPAVPEPGTLVLLAGGLLALAGIRRYRIR